jgi:hypothetical protein
MNGSLIWYRRVQWVAIAAHLALALVLFVDPDVLGLVFGRDRVEHSHVWLGAFGALLVALSAYLAVIASNPERYADLAWLAALEKVLASLLWAALVASPDQGAPFLPFLALDAAIAALSIALLARGLPPGARPAPAFQTPIPNRALRAFRFAATAGLAANLAFAATGLFAPSLIDDVLGLPSQGPSTVWIQSVAVVLFGESLLCLPAIAEPGRRRAVSWLAAGARLISALFWLTVVIRPGGSAFSAVLAVEGALAVALFALLQAGLDPAERQLRPGSDSQTLTAATRRA